MTLHLVRRPLPPGALGCVGSADIVVLVGEGGDMRPPPGVRCERWNVPGATLDDARLTALLFEVARVIAW